MVKKNILPLVIAVIILLLSLGRAETFGKINVLGIKHADKIVHAGMYFVLTMALLYENRTLIINAKRLLLLTTIPLLFGTLIEFLQSWLTTTRQGDFFDVCFNLIGIVLATIIWRLLKVLFKSDN